MVDLTSEQAGAIYDILDEHGGGMPGYTDRENFIYTMVQGQCREFRFCGLFGFGGKIRNNGNGVYVDYYPEDRTIERDARAHRVNMLIRRQLNGGT